MTFSVINHGSRQHIGVKPLFCAIAISRVWKKKLFSLSSFHFRSQGSFSFTFAARVKSCQRFLCFSYFKCDNLSIYSWLHVHFIFPSKTPTHEQSLECGDVRGSHYSTTLVFAAIFEAETLMGPITYLPAALPIVSDDTRRLVLSRVRSKPDCPYCTVEKLWLAM